MDQEAIIRIVVLKKYHIRKEFHKHSSIFISAEHFHQENYNEQCYFPLDLWDVLVNIFKPI